MVNYAEKIQRFSKIVYIFLMIAFVVQLIGAAVELVAWIFIKTEFEPFLKYGEITLYIPFAQASVTESSAGNTLFGGVRFWDVLKDAFAVYLLWTAKSVFKRLRDNGSPYRDEVVIRFKRLTVAFIIFGALSGFAGFLAAAICWVIVLLTDS
ncbi:MAG: hypothetical protein LBM98_03965 [Oscillospiraceae bacterium]|jgi:hypothetical protein|nr:hypothetical protein [Oscillospiraceae bacterium]